MNEIDALNRLVEDWANKETVKNGPTFDDEILAAPTALTIPMRAL